MACLTHRCNLPPCLIDATCHCFSQLQLAIVSHSIGRKFCQWSTSSPFPLQLAHMAPKAKNSAVPKQAAKQKALANGSQVKKAKQVGLARMALKSCVVKRVVHKKPAGKTSRAVVTKKPAMKTSGSSNLQVGTTTPTGGSSSSAATSADPPTETPLVLIAQPPNPISDFADNEGLRRFMPPTGSTAWRRFHREIQSEGMTIREGLEMREWNSQWGADWP